MILCYINAMRIAAARYSLLVASLSVASCDRPAIDPSQSLVGAKQLPSVQTLSREIIYLSRGYSWSGQGHLSYELRPDDTLTITYEHTDRHTLKKTARRETFHLSSNESNVALEARRVLWRLRPEKLEGIETIVRPSNCPQPPTDTFPEVAVGFIAEGPDPGVKDDRLGIVDVPGKLTCSSREATIARAVTRQVLASFPSSKVAAEFDQDKVFLPL
jgi:hypothetical protein